MVYYNQYSEHTNNMIKYMFDKILSMYDCIVVSIFLYLWILFVFLEDFATFTAASNQAICAVQNPAKKQIKSKDIKI